MRLTPRGRLLASEALIGFLPEQAEPGADLAADAIPA
jgi:hypothetical protein